jgi:hypothetical protein
MPRRKTFSPEESDERLAYALACGRWSNIVCCLHAGRVFRYRQQAADYIAGKMAQPGFRAKINGYEAMIADDEARLSRGHEEARTLNRLWVLAQLRRVYEVAMCEAPERLGDSGEEIFASSPHLGTAIRALAEMGRVLRLTDCPSTDSEDEDLAKALAEVRGGQAVPH